MKAINKGSALLMVVVILVVLMLVSLSFMRAAITANKIAGAIAFKEGASQAGDMGIKLAQIALNNLGNYEANVAGEYFATIQPTDANGLPTTITWSQVPTNAVGNYSVQFVIDRLCSGSLPIANFTTSCMLSHTPTESNKVGDTTYAPNNAVFYRVTVQITGPASTQSYIQAILLR